MIQNLTENIREVSEEEFQELIETLPKSQFSGTNDYQLFKYQTFWCDLNFLKNTINCQRNFVAKDTDIFITSLPKTGTTWLKSLLYSVVNRHNTTITQTPLLCHNPHELVPGLETDAYANVSNQVAQLSDPRLLSSHLPYASLPKSVRSSEAKIIHITRNPSDTLVSLYYFTLSLMNKVVSDFTPPTFEQFFEDFSEGRFNFGPYFENMLEYWNLSLEQPEKVLFLKYEDLMTHPKLHLKTLAEFVGMPFSTQEENDGVIDDIIELCSFKNIKELEVNKHGKTFGFVDKKSFFRKGEVGDWSNHFTPIMVEKMHELMEQHFKGTSLSFDFSITNETMSQ